MKPALLSGSFVLGLLAAGVVCAQAPSPPSPSPSATAPGQSSRPVEFASLDRNKDGRLSSAEAASSTELNSDFPNLDANHDSYLSSDEFSKWSRAGKGKSGMPSESGAGTPPAATPPIQ